MSRDTRHARLCAESDMDTQREAKATIEDLAQIVRRINSRIRATDPAVLRAILSRVDRVKGPSHLYDEPGDPLCVVRLLAAEALPAHA